MSRTSAVPRIAAPLRTLGQDPAPPLGRWLGVLGPVEDPAGLRRPCPRGTLECRWICAVANQWQWKNS